MPSRPPRLCSCGRVVAAGIRCECRQAADRERKARFDEKRPTARKRGYDNRWDKARAAYLLKHPICVKCGAPATVVDHVVPHRGDNKLFWNSANWQPLCTPCHSRTKQREERR